MVTEKIGNPVCKSRSEMKVFLGVGVEILVFWFLWPTGIDKSVIW